MLKAKFNQEELKKGNNQKKKEQNTEDKIEETKELSLGKFKIENYLQGEFELLIPAYKKPSFDKVFPIKINEIKITSIEKFFLCDGASLKCTQGDAQSTYSVLPIKKVFLNDKALAVVSDIKPMVNIKPFGQCKSMANPTVAAATAANRGQLQKMPCIPSTVGMWSEGISYFMAGEPVPCDKSKCNCAYAGEISIAKAGQNIAGASSNSSSSSDKEENEKEKLKNEEFKKIEFKSFFKKKSYKRDEE